MKLWLRIFCAKLIQDYEIAAHRWEHPEKQSKVHVMAVCKELENFETRWYLNGIRCQRVGLK